MKVGPALWRTASSAVALLALGLLIYWDFIFSGKTLLYKDIGSDSVNIFYPYYVLLSDYLRHTGVPSWSFQVGMGQNLFPYSGTVLISPVVWLAKATIGKALIYQHLLYLLASGLFFSQFFRARGLTFESSLLGALLLSFSAYMSMGSCWYSIAYEVVGFGFLLFAAEIGINRGCWLYLPLAVGFLGLIGAFHLYLCALLLCFYVPARLIELNSWQPLSMARQCSILAAAAFLGVGLAGIVIMPNLHGILNSPRGSGAIASIWPTPGLFQLEPPVHYVTALLRPFSNDILGTGSDFRGWDNYLEAPITYCGLFCLLIFPQVFKGAALRQRILYSAFLGLMLLPVGLPWFRHLFWLFRGGYYRTLSLFWIIGIVTLSMVAFSRYIERRCLNLWTLGATLLGLLGILYLPVDQIQTLVKPELRQMAAIFLGCYAGLLIAGQVLKRQRLAAWLIVGLAALELVCLDRITVSNRPTVTKQELKERVGYNDETVDAVRETQAGEIGFFRITKTWGSGPAMHASFNDALVFGYYGTASYSSFNNLNYVSFLLATEAISTADPSRSTQWSTGLQGHRLLSSFACEKYVLTKDPRPFETTAYYDFVGRYGDIYLFRNRLFLPFGLTFSRYITEEMLSQVPRWAKPLALLQAVVVSDRPAADRLGLSELTMDELKRHISEFALPETIAERRDTALDIRSFRETRIAGTTHLREKGILVVQTPFDPGWHAFLNGRPAPTLRVDAGLLGVAVESGEQTLELRYRPPLFFAGAAVTLLSCCVLFLSLWKWPRIPAR